MFSNPGRGIKILAKVVFAINILIVLAVIAFLPLDSVRPYLSEAILRVVIAVVGLVVSWLISIFIYAYGSLVEDVKEIKERLWE